MSFRPMPILLTLAAVPAMSTPPTKAAQTWSWAYNGSGISAMGTFTTSDQPDADGFYRILDIAGTDNGVAITGLQPAGTAIPGNEPYAVDNLVSLAAPQLTVHGFGFSLANGDYANPFHTGSGYFEYLSSPPYANGAGVEKPISFTATLVPEPSSILSMLTALAGFLGQAWRGRPADNR